MLYSCTHMATVGVKGPGVVFLPRNCRINRFLTYLLVTKLGGCAWNCRVEADESSSGTSESVVVLRGQTVQLKCPVPDDKEQTVKVRLDEAGIFKLSVQGIAPWHPDHIYLRCTRKMLLCSKLLKSFHAKLSAIQRFCRYCSQRVVCDIS